MLDRIWSHRFAGAIAAAAILVPVVALAQAPAPATPPGDSALYAKSAQELFKLLVMSILIDQALAAIFNWKLYRELFDGRGLKTVVMFAVSYLAVSVFGVDVVHKIMNEYGTSPSSDIFSKTLTALILSGGSGGVNALMQRFGIRPTFAAASTPAPKTGKAWVSVSIKRKKAVGGVKVMLGPVDPSPANKPVALAGFVAERPFSERLAGVFLKNQTRFPQSGGHEVDITKVYSLKVEGIDANGAAVNSSIDGQYMFAEGSILDLVAEV